MKIGIIGGGIIGLTSGVVLAEAGHDVRVMSREPIERSTSWAAGATCYPFGCEESERSIGWFLRSCEVLKSLQNDPAAGIYAADWQKLSGAAQGEIPFWYDRYEGARVLEPHEVPAPYRSGITAPLLIMGVDEYVPYVMARFKAAGGAYEIRDVAGVEEVSADFDVVINCTGVAARDFVPDTAVYPARGQVVVVRNPGVKKHTALFENKFYCYPRGSQVLLGGSFDEHEWERTPDEGLTREILKWAGAFEPLLAEPEVIDVRVGLRPMRPKVRLEKETCADGTPLIHNYGHGGAGFTLSWGCADQVLALL